MGRLSGKSIVVTGAAGRIGKAASLLFAVEGGLVVAADINGAAVEQVAREASSANGVIVPLEVDVRSRNDNERMIDCAIGSFGRLDALFCNAGIMHPEDGNAESASELAWNSTIETNLIGMWLSCRAAIPIFRSLGGGSIVNNASVVALVGSTESQLAYTASKGAVVAFTRELAVSYARDGIRANSLCPGPLSGGVLASRLDRATEIDRRTKSIPMKRLAEADDVARAVLWLASEESGYVTGTELIVDGGIQASYIVE